MVIIIVLLLTIIENFLLVRIVAKEEEDENIYKRRIIALSSSGKSPDEKLKILDIISRDFFYAEFGFGKDITYYEISEKFMDNKKSKILEFCQEMQNLLYSGEKTNSNQVKKSMKLFYFMQDYHAKERKKEQEIFEKIHNEEILKREIKEQISYFKPKIEGEKPIPLVPSDNINLRDGLSEKKNWQNHDEKQALLELKILDLERRLRLQQQEKIDRSSIFEKEPPAKKEISIPEKNKEQKPIFSKEEQKEKESADKKNQGSSYDISFKDGLKADKKNQGSSYDISFKDGLKADKKNQGSSYDISFNNLLKDGKKGFFESLFQKKESIIIKNPVIKTSNQEQLIKDFFKKDSIQEKISTGKNLENTDEIKPVIPKKETIEHRKVSSYNYLLKADKIKETKGFPYDPSFKDGLKADKTNQELFVHEMDNFERIKEKIKARREFLNNNRQN